jgi:hypothetical protein
MKVCRLGGPKTAKRKIQIRQYLTERQATASHSDPFLPQDESDARDQLSPRIPRFRFTTQYVADETPEEIDETPEEIDEILSKKVNLDDADRFVASLRIRPKRTRTPQPVQKAHKFKNIETKLLATARKELGVLAEIQMADCIDPSEDDEQLI